MAGVAITGVAGFLGQGLLRRLAGSSSADRLFPGILGLDVAGSAFRPRELEMHLVDVTRADLVPRLEGIEVLVHLAGVHDAIPDVDLMARVNVAGTRRVLEAAGAARVRKVILGSSATVYGAWPNNPIPLNEDAPLRPNPGFPLGAHKAEAERLLAGWKEEHPDAVVTVLRMATVVGHRADHALARLLRSRVPLVLAGASAPVQFLHEEDAVEALALAVAADLPGAYNVAADGWLSRDDLRGLLGRRIQPGVSPELAKRILGRLWPAGLVDLPPSAIPYLLHPWVVAIDRLRAAGWSPGHSNEDAVLACVEHRPSPPRAKLATAVAVGAGAAAAGMIVGARRRR
ncbi:MAG TPA: NAD-dependent epimerase/dehydratase family protein [Acidimicrobiia bacterium]